MPTTPITRSCMQTVEGWGYRACLHVEATYLVHTIENEAAVGPCSSAAAHQNQPKMCSTSLLEEVAQQSGIHKIYQDSI